jgi:hypothetical protein
MDLCEFEKMVTSKIRVMRTRVGRYLVDSLREGRADVGNVD